MARSPGTGRQSGASTGFLEGVTPGGTHYWYSPLDPTTGFLENSVLAKRYPMSYIYGLAAHTPTGAETQQVSAGVEVQGTALGERIAVIYGLDRVAGDVFFGPWADGRGGVLTDGCGLGEGPIDSLTKVETSGGVVVNASPGASFTGYGGSAGFRFYAGVDAPAAADPFFVTVATLYGQSFDERYPGLAYVSRQLTFDPVNLSSYPDLRFTVKGRKLLDPRLGVDGSGLPNQPAVWSDNPMLCLVDYFISTYYGLGTPMSQINWTSVADIADWCDETQSDGRKRFTFNSTLRVEASHKANIDFIRSHFRCTYSRTQGKIKFYVDAPAAAVKVFDELDRSVSYATNATPIVLTVPGHLRSSGDSVLIAGVTGNTAANGRWTATVIDADTLSLDGSVGNGVYIDGGAIVGNCRPLHRWRTPPAQIPTKVKYQWTDPSRDYQPATATDILPAAQAGLTYTRTAEYDGDGCRNAGQGQSQATYLRKKRGKDLNHSIICSRAEGLAMEMYDVCVLNLPSFGITGYEARIVRITKLPTGEYGFDFEEYDSTIYGEIVAGTETKPAVTLPNPLATPPTPDAPVLTQEGLNIKVAFSSQAPPYPYYAGQKITVQPAGGVEYVLGPLVAAGPLYIERATMGLLYTVRAYVVNFAGLVSAAATATITPALATPEAPVCGNNSGASRLFDFAVSLNLPVLRFRPPQVRTRVQYGASRWSSTISGFDASKINDGNIAAVAGSVVNNDTITLDLGVGVTKDIREVRAWFSPIVTPADPVISEIAYSDGGVIYTVRGGSAFPQNYGGPGSSFTEFDSQLATSGGAHRFWRFKFKVDAASTPILITELQVYEWTGAAQNVASYNVYDMSTGVPVRRDNFRATDNYDVAGGMIDLRPFIVQDSEAASTQKVAIRLTSVDDAGTESGYIDDYVSWPFVSGTSAWSSLAGTETLRNKTIEGATLAVTSPGTALDKLTVQGPDIASATTTNIGAGTGLNINITGTTTITAFDSVTAGIVRVLKFAAALTLTHNATSLILPGAASITTAAGDVAIMESLGAGNWRCMSYMRAAAAPWNNAIAAANVTGLGSLATQSATLPSGAIVGTTDSQTLTNKTLTTPTVADFTNAQHSHQGASGGGILEVAATRFQYFILKFTNTAGTLQHSIFADPEVTTAPAVNAPKINAASVTLTNTPAIAAGVGFATGVGVEAANTNIVNLDTTAQVSADVAGFANVIYNDTNVAGALNVIAQIRTRSINVNGVTQRRMALEFWVNGTGAAFPITAANIGSGKLLFVQVGCQIR